MGRIFFFFSHMSDFIFTLELVIDPYGAYMCHNPLMAVGTVSIFITKETFIWRVEKPDLHLVSLKCFSDRQRSLEESEMLSLPSPL